MSTHNDTRPLYLFVDFEATSPDATVATPLETAFVFIDYDANGRAVEIDHLSALHDVPREQFDTMDDGAKQINTMNGIRDDLYVHGHDTESIQSVERRVISMRDWIVSDSDFVFNELVLCGTGITDYDRILIERFYPQLNRILSFRFIDVAILRRALKMMGVVLPLRERPFATMNHRALDDCRQAMSQLDYIRTHCIKLDSQ